VDGLGKRRNVRGAAWAVWAACALALLAASAPYLYGWLSRPPGSRFYAVPPVNYADATQYLALARQAEEGRLLLGDPFTAEPHVPRLVLPHVLLEAALSRAGLGPIGAFQATRVVYGAALLAAAWWFGTLLLPRRRLRWLYLALLLFSSGATWLLERFGIYLPAADANQPEGNTLFTLGNLPHLCLATALLVTLFGTRLALEGARPPERRRWLVLTCLAALALSWTHPFDFLPLLLGLAAYSLISALPRTPTPPDQPLPHSNTPTLRLSVSPSLRLSVSHAAVLLLGAAPAAVYNGWLVLSDPFYRALANDPLQVQPFAFYAVAYGLLALPALVVLFHRRLRRRYALPLCWVVAAFLFLVLPFRLGGKQPRVVEGIHIPLCILAAVGMDWIARAAARRRRPAARRAGHYAALAGGYCLLTWTGGWGVLERHFASYAAREPDPYVVADVRRVLSYLEAHRRPGDLVLAGRYTSGWAPVFTGTTVYYGHWHMTLDSEAKRLERNRMYGRDVPNAERAAWLRRHRITWVILYPGEWEGTPAGFDRVAGVRVALRTPEATLYHVGR
jgi:hypothetical protein